MRKEWRWSALEPWGFFLALLLTVVPVFLHPFLISLDGPMHLYNARVIADLWNGGDWSTGYFSLNEYLVPNWSSHLVLAFLLPFLGPEWAMRIHHIVLLLALGYAFRGLIRTVNPKYPVLSILILPFFWSWFIMLGFYNFLWGAVLFLILIRLAILNSGKVLLQFITGLGFGVLLYFSHPSWLIISALGLFLLALLSFKKSHKDSFSILSIMAGMTPAFYGLFRFMNKSSLSWESDSYLGIDELSSLVYKVYPLVMFHWAKEGPWLRMIVIGGVLLYISLLLFRKQDERLRYHFVNWSLLFAVVLTILFLILPDATSTGSYVSTRLLFSLLIVLFLSMAATARNSGWSIVSIVIILTGHFALVNLYNSFYSIHDSRIEQLMAWGRQLPPNSTIAIRNEGEWFFDHIESFAALEKPLILHNNSEAITGYFPVIVDPKGNDQAEKLKESADYLIWINEESKGSLDGYSVKAFNNGMFLLEKEELEQVP